MDTCDWSDCPARAAHTWRGQNGTLDLCGHHHTELLIALLAKLDEQEAALA